MWFSEYICIKDAEVEEIYGWNERGREVRWCVRRGGRGQGRMEAVESPDGEQPKGVVKEEDYVG